MIVKLFVLLCYMMLLRISYETLAVAIGKRIADYVLELTNTKDPSKNRVLRKFEECEAATTFSIGAKIIRLCDILHNCESIIEQDPKFAKTYKTSTTSSA